MAQAIKLDQDRRSMTTAVEDASVLKCLGASADDVFVRGITDEHQRDLLAGDSMHVDAGTTLTIRIFCKRPGAVKYSCELSLTPKKA